MRRRYRISFALAFALFLITPARGGSPHQAVSVPVDLGGRAAGQAHALSLASADFDEDGVADLVSGYADGRGGVVALQRGDATTRRQGAPPFPAAADVFDLPEPPDLLGAGDFDDDGHVDLLAAAAGGRSIHLLPGDGQGGFGGPLSRRLEGKLLAMVTADLDRPDGLADFALAMEGPKESSILQVYEGPLGAWIAAPESFDAEATVIGLTARDLDGDLLADLVARTGQEVVIVRGRDRKLSLSAEARATAAPARLERIPIESPLAPELSVSNPAVLPMRLDGDALDDLVMLRDDPADPISIGGSAPLTTFDVTNTNDSGAGSLRDAIQNANVLPGADAIAFNIPGPAPYIISPTSPLPGVTGPVQIDGTTQPGYAGTPIIQLDGASAGLGADGLFVTSGATTVRGLVIRRFDGNGIRLRSGGGNLIEGNYIGTDATGAVAMGNRLDGILINDAAVNTIGGTAPGTGNLISGNQANGVEIDTGPGVVATYSSSDVPKFIADLSTTVSTMPVPAPGAVIDVDVSVRITHTYDGDLRLVLVGPDGTRVDLSLNNGGSGDDYQGTLFDDSGAIPIGSGAPPFASPPSYIPQSPLSALNGGPAAGPWTLEIRDTAGGDVGELLAWSIRLATAPSFGNQVLGNLIGINAAGSAALANGVDGVRIVNSPSNVIGGPAAAQRNVISGNTRAGVETVLPGAVKNTIQGNYIGTDRTGTSPLPQIDGVLIASDQNLIGGTAAGAGNVVSGNGTVNFEVGVHLTGNGNLVQGNFLGTDPTGTASVPNYYAGVEAEGSFNTIGGGVPGAGNLISGNTLIGITLGPGGGNNTVQGNLIGLRIGGTAALSNGTAGINVLGSTSNQIGGSTPAERNVISANLSGGIALSQIGPTFGGNRVEGNYIGTDITGTVPLGNDYHGVSISSESNVIGGPAGSGRGNLISANTYSGVSFNLGANLNQVMGNIIGLDAAGSAPLPNASDGISIGGSDNTIEGNVISANGGAGIRMVGWSTTQVITAASSDVPKPIADLSIVTSTLVLSDPSIITDLDVSLDITHTFDSDLFVQLVAPDNTGIVLSNRRGGSGANFAGTQLDDEGSTPIASGAAPFASPPSYVPEQPLAAFDGQPAAGTWRLEVYDLAGGDVGTLNSWSITYTTVVGPYGASNQILGNQIGTNAMGTLARGNAGPGVLIEDATGNQIGGLTPGSLNLISANLQGVRITGTGSVGTVVRNNLIGTEADGFSPLGNVSDGVLLSGGASANWIGSSVGNTIAFNGGAGVRVESGRGNAIRGNAIRSNAGLGIDLDPPGVNANDPGDGDNGPNDLMNYPTVVAAPGGLGTKVNFSYSGRPDSQMTFDVYANSAPDPSGFGEGRTYILMVVGTTDGAGNFTFAGSVAGLHNFVTATATDQSRSTSEYSKVGGTVLEASPAKDMIVEKPPGPQLKVTYTPACGATDHAIYWGIAGPMPIGPGGLSWINGACGMGVSGTAFFDPGPIDPGRVFYFIIAGQNGSVEGSYGQDSVSVEEPEAILPIVCDQPQYLGGICS